MSYIFPPSPLPGDVTVGPNGATWVWDGTKWVGGMGGPYLSLAGGTMEGPLYLYTNPTLPFEAATKAYVDAIQLIPPAPMDGQSYGRMLNTWNPVLPRTGGFMRGTIDMVGWPLTGLRMPVLPTDAVSLEYLDQLISELLVYEGTWEVGPNIPDISDTTNLVNGSYYLAVTADPAVPEAAPGNIPGIGGRFVQNGSWVVWNANQQIYQLLQSGQLTRTEADLLYVKLAGSTMTGELILDGDPVQALQAATKQYVDNEIADAINNLPPGGGGGIPEAPTDGQTYGREGATQSWNPVITIPGLVNGGNW